MSQAQRILRTWLLLTVCALTGALVLKLKYADVSWGNAIVVLAGGSLVALLVSIRQHREQ